MDEVFIQKTGCICNSRGVQCIKKDKCDHCGWNPSVEKSRKQKVNEMYKDFYMED